MINDRGEIADLGLQRQVIDLSLGSATPATISPHHQPSLGQTIEQGAAVGVLPVELQAGAPPPGT